MSPYGRWIDERIADYLGSNIAADNERDWRGPETPALKRPKIGGIQYNGDVECSASRLSMPAMSFFPNASLHWLVLILGLGWFAPPALLGAPQDASPVTPFEAPDSTLGKFTAELKEVIQLSTKEGKLIPVFATDGNTARSELQQASQKVRGANGGSSSSSGGNNWSTTIRGSQLSIAAGFGQRYGSPFDHPTLVNGKDTFYMELRQLDGDRPQVTVSAKEDSTFEIILEDRQGIHTFEFTQTASGQVRCVELSPSIQFACSAENFDELAARHPTYVAQRLGPLFQYVGVGAPPSRYSPSVMKYVLARLRPADPDRQQKFKEMVAGMDAQTYEKRQEATESLETSFDAWKDEIKAAISDPQFSAEVRSRLKKIYDSQVSTSEKVFRELASKNKLEQNTDYLIWLLDKLPLEDEAGRADRDRVCARLAELTNQTFGQDIAQWKAWHQQQLPAVNNEQDSIPTATLLASDGVLDACQTDLSAMLRLKLEDGKLLVDEAYWQEQLQGKTVPELFKEIEDYIESKNLPPSWFQPGGHSFPVQTVQFPQIVFERMTAGQEVDPTFAQRAASYSRYVRNTGNREFVGKQLVGLLEVHQHDRRQMFFGQAQQDLKEIEQEYLRLQMRELDKDKRSLSFWDDRQGGLIISLRFPLVNCEMRLVQLAEPDEQGDRVFLFDARGDQVSVSRAADIPTLIESQGELWEQHANPLLNKFGIQIQAP